MLSAAGTQAEPTGERSLAGLLCSEIVRRKSSRVGSETFALNSCSLLARSVRVAARLWSRDLIGLRDDRKSARHTGVLARRTLKHTIASRDLRLIYAALFHYEDARPS